MTRNHRLMAFTGFALGAIVVHGLYHLAEAGFVPRVIYTVLNPFFAPTTIGWAFHVLVELMGIAALIVAIWEYQHADEFEIPKHWTESDLEDDWDPDIL